MLDIGKLPNDLLQSLLNQFSEPLRKEVHLKPAIGEDCAAVDFSNDLCVITTDPITGAEDNIGALAVHISCNDLASSGAEAVGLMVTLLVPPHSTYEQISEVMTQIKEEARRIGADIIGGHTEVTDAVNRMVVSITALGRVKRGGLVATGGASAGDDIVLTKYAGTEGTVILAYMFENELKKALGEDTVLKAKGLMKSISVVREGLISAKFGVSGMHDVTEGGVLGGVWEICAASGLGAKVDKKSIPILKETEAICSYLGINPLKLISSGCMLITVKDGSSLVDILSNNGIPASVIGRLTESNDCLLLDDDKVVKIQQPESDELYKARLMRG